MAERSDTDDRTLSPVPGAESRRAGVARLSHRVRSSYARWMVLRPRPFFRAHMMWQRARRGFSDEDVWSFHTYLEQVIGGGVAEMARVAHGYPITPLNAGVMRGVHSPTENPDDDPQFQAWLGTLETIRLGMESAADYSENWKWRPGGKREFDQALAALHFWWFGLWD